MSGDPPTGIDFSHAGEIHPGIHYVCPHCGEEFEQARSMEDYTEVYGPDGEESWYARLEPGREVEVTVAWSISYSIIDLKEL